MAKVSIPICAGTTALAAFFFAAQIAVAAPAASDDDVVLWTEIQKATTSTPYKDYLARFPNGAYAPMARAKLDALMVKRVTAPADKGTKLSPACTQNGDIAVSAGEAGDAGDVASGDTEAEACRKCHVFEVGRPSRSTGPNLAVVFGAKAAAVADFKFYSVALQNAGQEGLVWDAENLDAYLKNPGDFLEKRTGSPNPIHNMFFKLTDAVKRTQVIAYIQSLARCR